MELTREFLIECAEKANQVGLDGLSELWYKHSINGSPYDTTACLMMASPFLIMLEVLGGK